MIAHDPLHRSGRAELPHPAPTLGNNAQAHERIRMTDTRRRKPSRYMALHAAPRQVVTLAATAQHRPPQPAHCLAQGAQRRSIHGHPVITEMAQQDRAQIRSLFPNGRVHASPQYLFQSLRNRALISRLHTRPARPPVNASTPPSRAAPHDSGPLWFATPSTCETFIHNTLPV
jgi:hypothetical protein